MNNKSTISSLLLASAALLWTFPVHAQSPMVAIKSPIEGQIVMPLTDVSGTAAEGINRVWVVIHPTLTADCWVQGVAIVDDDHTWILKKAHFGDAGSSGAPFEVRALTDPPQSIKVGVTQCWPDAPTYSRAINVTRQ